MVALAAAAGTAVVLDGVDRAEPVRYQPVSYAGENPFASPVGTDRPGVAPVPGAGGEQDGDTPEMYAADPAAPVCDADALIAALAADPARAAVWAQVQRTTPDRVPAFVKSLTPVVLRTETAVVDHGYRGGVSVPTPSVLAAGTAVFVNSYGQPVVKCFSGNPLTPGTSSDPAVTTVVPAATPITTLVVHDPVGQGPVAQPGRPDTTGGGPVPVEPDGSTGGAPIPVEPDGGTGGTGGTPGPDGTPIPVEPDGGTGGTPGTPSTPPLTGTFTWDGSVVLSDGRLQRPDGRIVDLPPVPAGSTPLPDGGYRDANGTYRNRDGSPRDEVPLTEQGGEVILLAPDGTLTDGSGREIRPIEGLTVIRGHDGFVTVLTDNPRGEDTLVLYAPEGKPVNIVTGTITGGVITDAGGRVRNPDGSERQETTLPDGGRVLPDGTNVPAPGRPGGGPAHPGIPTPTVPIDPPFTPRPIDPASPRGADEASGEAGGPVV
ncbi:hypothetical protein GCM10023203_47900 [Actinomycetospora straminea]|uniref:DUF6777 domain-containing protein n=1 Tax=Actinomycetospora straminea TaxID=663607 RepID=A0ABP9EZ61_9PSEU